jgi:CPA1 family monovalent cation:H+ antiporter
MMHILEGESLLNDASGLVCLRFAVAAALTGTFSPAAAAINFVWVAGGAWPSASPSRWPSPRSRAG